MRRTAITVLTLAAALACGACGSSGGSDGSNAASASSAVTSSEAAPSSAQSAAQQCSSQTWPQKLPDFHGKALGEMVVGAGLCYNITAITAPDGTDVMHDAAGMTKPWTVASQSPAAGTSVTAQTPITLKVTAAQHN
ncbi:PASTA domain-containing protein [Nocardia jiangxiensis]|uniref:PASTA domain-containing protein n=1 Tax=Nocardia jiangxiensis TaxID=282685 RepID=A0ABW6S9T0_9NOCA|nr:PASTA domain-containing protein [Nocardia jiangxiensis]